MSPSRVSSMPWYQAMVVSTTQRNTPSPEPWAAPRRAMCGRIPLARNSRRYLSSS